MQSQYNCVHVAYYVFYYKILCFSNNLVLSKWCFCYCGSAETSLKSLCKDSYAVKRLPYVNGKTKATKSSGSFNQEECNGDVVSGRCRYANGEGNDVTVNGCIEWSSSVAQRAHGS